MIPNDNIEVVLQRQMVVAWIRLRQMKKLKETKPNDQNLPHKNSKLLLIKILLIIEIIKMILTRKVIVIITVIIIIIIIIITTTTTIIIKCRGKYRTPTTTNTELLVTLHHGRKPLSNIKKSSPSDAVRAL